VWNCENQGLDVKGDAQVDENHEPRVPIRPSVLHRLVVAKKVGNSAGAKESNQAVIFLALRYFSVSVSA
jgi:hypothetical protein